jgi:hypothetical protein
MGDIITHKEKMLLCAKSDGEHHYIPTSWSKSNTSKHVTMLLCTRCFKRVNLEEIFKHFPADPVEPEPQASF